MPWKETWPMRERRQLVALYETGRYTVTELARHFEVSRKTAHKWLARAAAGEDEGLADRSRAPLTHPNATPDPVVTAVVEAKLDQGTAQAHPGASSPQGGGCRLASSQYPRSDSGSIWADNTSTEATAGGSLHPAFCRVRSAQCGLVRRFQRLVSDR